MYGRVSSKLPHDNPYWRRRHAREAARESLAARRRERGQEGVALPSSADQRALAASARREE
jgi:hypothetical protein